jgi:hypothetical protein
MEAERGAGGLPRTLRVLEIVEPAEVLWDAPDLDSCSPTALLWIPPDADHPARVACWACPVSSILERRDFPEIANTIIVADAVDVIDLVCRPTAMRQRKYKAMGAK